MPEEASSTRTRAPPTQAAAGWDAPAEDGGGRRDASRSQRGAQASEAATLAEQLRALLAAAEPADLRAQQARAAQAAAILARVEHLRAEGASL
jgi:hypothetical protein